MAASSKPTAVHFTLAFFVTTTLVLAVVCYLNAKELAKTQADVTAARDQATKNQNDFTKLLDEVNALNQTLGYPGGDLGAANVPATELEDGTVRKSLHQDLVKLGQSHVAPADSAPTAAATLLEMSTAIGTLNTTVATKDAEVTTLTDRLNQEVISHQNERQKLQVSQAESEKQRQDKVLEQNEILKEKDDEISRLDSEKNRIQKEKAQIQDELTAVRAEKDAQIGELTQTVFFLRRKLDDVERVSFEVPDGAIVRVISGHDGKVWINLGKLDGLRNQTPFSVYVKNHDGMARETGDVKARIEVIEVTEDHLAQARIISEDKNRPIQPGDPIYTPLWTAGQKDYFGFVGDIDINGDGKSSPEEREKLHDILRHLGAEIDVEIDDHGARLPEEGSLTVQTKFLVVGHIPDPSAVPGIDEARRAEIQAIQTAEKSLQEEAIRKGVRVVSLSNFLTFAGISPQERLYLPGDGGDARKLVLKSGAQSGSLNEELGNRVSAGTVSKLFEKKKAEEARKK